MAPQILGRLPILSHLMKWFKGDELTVDNALFRVHHQGSTFVVMFGFIFVFLENHLDGRAIVCHGNADNYARAYCWIHGTAYVRPHLQSKATGCYVDQSHFDSPADAPVTAYYLWIPFLLLVCFGLAKVARSLWRNVLEGNLMSIVIQDGDPTSISNNFFDFRRRFRRYHLHFGLCEMVNLLMLLLSVVITDSLLLNKFWSYGKQVSSYIWSTKHVNEDGRFITHDPMCELFPTEVSCYINVGASTGGLDSVNYLCILSNNLFNQKYFFVLWLWWVALACVSVLGLIYRLARLSIPDLSRNMLLRQVVKYRLDDLPLTGADCFFLDMLAVNIPHHVFDEVMDQITKRMLVLKDIKKPAGKTTEPMLGTTSI